MIRQRLSNDHLDLNFNNESLNIVSSDKKLGLFVDHNLTWSDHIKHLTKKQFFKYLASFLKLKRILSQVHSSDFKYIFNHILTFVTF